MIPSTSQGTSHGKPHHLHTDWNAIAPLNQLFSCLTWERFTSHTKLSCFSYGGVILKSPTLYKDSGMFPLWILGISIIPKYYQSLSAQKAVERKNWINEKQTLGVENFKNFKKLNICKHLLQKFILQRTHYTHPRKLRPWILLEFLGDYIRIWRRSHLVHALLSFVIVLIISLKIITLMLS